MDAILSGKNHQIGQRLNWARHHRDRLDGIAAELASMLDVPIGTNDAKDLRAAVYGEIHIDEAMQRMINRKLVELSSIEIEGVIE